MGYRFRGFFSNGDADVMSAAARRWPFCSAKSVATPFHGFGIRAPDPDCEAASEEEFERLRNLSYLVEDGLAEFSREYPTDTFVFLDADCFGGNCQYTGFTVRAGEIGHRVQQIQTGTDPLDGLLASLGVPAKGGHFAPFVRGFWGET